MSYNGYENYETWAVSLWLDNDASTYFNWASRATKLLVENEFDVAQTEFELAQEIKEVITDDNHPLVEDASMYSDLLNSALRSVNWQEVASSFVELAQEELEPEAE